MGNRWGEVGLMFTFSVSLDFRLSISCLVCFPSRILFNISAMWMFFCLIICTNSYIWTLSTQTELTKCSYSENGGEKIHLSPTGLSWNRSPTNKMDIFVKKKIDFMQIKDYYDKQFLMGFFSRKKEIEENQSNNTNLVKDGHLLLSYIRCS